MNSTATLQPAFQNFAAALRRQVQWTNGGALLELDGMLLAFGATHFPAGPFNAVLSTDQHPHCQTQLDTAEALFARAGRNFTVYVRQDVDAELEVECQARGYLACGELSIMSLQQGPMAERATEQCVEVVSDASGVERFADVASRSFAGLGLPQGVARSAFSLPERLLDPGLHLVLGHVERQPAACALLLESAGCAGLYWVGTVPGARGLGLASACVTVLTRSAFSAGARSVILQASPQLEPFYRRLGFSTVARLGSYAKAGARPARNAARS